MRAGSSLAEHTLPSTEIDAAKESMNDGYEAHIMNTIPLPDHALNYMILSTGVSYVHVSLDSIELQENGLHPML